VGGGGVGVGGKQAVKVSVSVLLKAYRSVVDPDPVGSGILWPGSNPDPE
jgi:hypothetical protein